MIPLSPAHTYSNWTTSFQLYSLHQVWAPYFRTHPLAWCSIVRVLLGISNAYQVSYFLCPHVPPVLSEFLPSALLCLVAFTSSIPPPALLILTSTLVLIQTFPLTFFNPIMNFLLQKVKVKSLSSVWLFATPWTVPARLLHPWDFSRQEHWSGLPFPSPGDIPNPGIEPRSPALQADSLLSELQGKLLGIFPTRGLNPGLSYYRQILYQLSHKGSPRILEWVACPFSRGSSQPRNRTGLFCIAGRLFTNWAIREALYYYCCNKFPQT